MDQDSKKQAVARAALAYVSDGDVVGVGTGSTAECFIDALAELGGRIAGAVASSERSAARLRAHGIAVLELNEVAVLPVYVDGADEATRAGHLIKGGGGALTREKIVADAARRFVCVVDDSKIVTRLGAVPLPVEVIPMARAQVARKLAGLGGRAVLREGFVTDNGNQILDVHDLAIADPAALESELDHLVGVVCNGLFARRGADVLLVGGDSGVTKLYTRTVFAARIDCHVRASPAASRAASVRAPSAMSAPAGPRKGRGAASNASGRFESQQREAVDDGWGTQDEPPAPLRTRMDVDHARSVISYNTSPDVPFDRSINPYRGCEHGCVYCYARPTHAWLGLSPGLDFESRLFHKPDAPEQLVRELAAPRYRPQPICLGANTDPYQPVERGLRLTRRIVEVLHGCDHPLRIVTKGALIERDLDLLADMATRDLVSVSVSVTSLDRQLSRRLEPRAAAPERRLETVARLAQAGIPVRVLIAPVIPALNDEHLESIMQRAREAGAGGAGYVLLRLPLEIRDLFVEWLDSHYPLRKEHVMARVRDSRGGKEYDAAFGTRMKGTGLFAELLAKRFRLAATRLGFGPEPELDCSRFRAPVPPRDPADRQLSLL